MLREREKKTISVTVCSSIKNNSLGKDYNQYICCAKGIGNVIRDCDNYDGDNY